MDEAADGFLAAREDIGVVLPGSRASPPGVTLELCNGADHCAVRWNTVRWPAVLATSVMVWMPVAPVPITATRLPSKLTGSFGQLCVWQDWP